MSAYTWHANWQSLLDEYDDAIITYAQVKAQPDWHAKRHVSYEGEFWDISVAKKFWDSGNRETEYYPYVEERMQEAVREALDWMVHPPTQLREGLCALVKGKKPKNLVAIVSLYGEFRAHLGVLQAPDFLGTAAFPKERKSGSSAKSRRLKTYIASYLQAHMNEYGNGEEAAIKAFGKHAEEIVFTDEPAPFGLTKNDFGKYLRAPRPRKMGEKDVFLLKIREFRKLFDTKTNKKKTHKFWWRIWVNDHLVFDIQKTTLHKPKKLKPPRFTF